MLQKKNEVFEQIGILGTILDEIKLDLSSGDIRKKYNLNTLLIDKDEDMTDDEIISTLTILIHHGLYLNQVD